MVNNMMVTIKNKKLHNTRGHHAAGVVKMIRRKHRTVFLLLTFLVFSSESSMVFQTLACETLDAEVEYLRADYRIQCTDGCQARGH